MGPRPLSATLLPADHHLVLEGLKRSGSKDGIVNSWFALCLFFDMALWTIVLGARGSCQDFVGHSKIVFSMIVLIIILILVTVLTIMS